MTKRRPTKPIFVGGVKIGGDAPVVVQSMTKTDTRDVKATVEQSVGFLKARFDLDLEVVEREAEDGTEVVEVELPAVLTATNAEANLPRIPKVRDVMAAHRKPIQVLTPSLAAELRQWAVLGDLYVPTRESRCRMVEGDSPEAKVDALLRELRQLRVL